MNIQILEPFNMAYIRLTGPYGQGIPEAIDKINKWSAENDLPEPTRVHIFHDDPEVTPAEECRADIGVVVTTGITPADGVKIQELSGGKYIVDRKMVTSVPEIIEIWDKLVQEMDKKGHGMDDRPCFELYHPCKNDADDVSVCISVK